MSVLESEIRGLGLRSIRISVFLAKIRSVGTDTYV